MPKYHRIGIIMNGVTGRMGTNQHLLRSIMPIIKQGGVKISTDEFIVPDPILVGRNKEKLKKLLELTGLKKYSLNLYEVLADPAYQIYFDAQTTDRRVSDVNRAIEAGKHIYCEKPTALNTREAMELYTKCESAGLKHGVVQDKLWLPGLLKLKSLIDNGFFGKILSVRGEFGYWVFEGHSVAPQRPSWNYRKEDGGGIVLDMLCHWRYVLDNLFGKVKRVSCLATTHIPERYDEKKEKYICTADDAAYATFQIENDIVAHFNSSWVTRVRRDDLLIMHVDGTKASAVAGLRKCLAQEYDETPKPVWNPDVEETINFYEDWKEVMAEESYENAFKMQWELFLKHVVEGSDFPWNLKEGAKGVQLAEKGYESSQKLSWVSIEEL